MKIKTSKKDVLVLTDILSKQISSASKAFSNQISRYDSPVLRRISDESSLEHNFYIVCVYLCCSFIEQSVSLNVAAGTMTSSLLAFRSRESFMSHISQMELSSDFSFIEELERSVIRTPLMSDLGYYNELCRFSISKALDVDQPSSDPLIDPILINLNIGQKLESWVVKTINEISIAYNTAMPLIIRRKKRNILQSAEAAAVALVLIGLLIPVTMGIISSSEGRKSAAYSKAYISGYNNGAIEGARCGVDWVYESLGETPPNVDYESIISEYSFYSFPLDEYYE